MTISRGEHFLDVDVFGLSTTRASVLHAAQQQIRIGVCDETRLIRRGDIVVPFS